MSDPAAEFAKLKAMHADAVLLKEGGVPLPLLPKFKFRAAGKEQIMDLLLYPAQQGGYATRLFLERKIEGVKDNPNWTSQRILEREWWVISWKDVPATLPWTAILCAHLRALA
jgi:hypothetical protein